MATLKAQKKKRLLKLEFIGALVALTGLVVMHGRTKVAASANASELEIIQSLRLPLKELSAMVPIQMSEAGDAIIAAIGDHNAEFATASFESGELRLTSFNNFQGSLLKRFGVCTVMQNGECRKMGKWLSSQWEAMAADNKNLFALHEQAGFVAKISRATHEVIDTISLDYYKETPENDASPNPNREKIGDNSLGEGLVLLKRGRMLVAKQDHPAQLIEFGVEGEIPLGYSRSQLINTDADWTQESRSIVPLHKWQIPNEFKQCDLNELTFDHVKDLYLLSKRCKMIFKIGALDPNEEQIRIEGAWELPSQVNYAESLIVLPGGRFLIGEDVKTAAPNIFLMISSQNISSN